MDRLAYVAVGRGGADAQSGGELGIDIAFVQVGQDRQGLVARRHAPPPCALPSMPRAQLAGQEARVKLGRSMP